MIRVMFVCTGNICRSPTAEGILRRMAADRGLSAEIESRSCGIIAYHTGESPDARAAALAASRGYDLSGQRASQIKHADFHECDYLLAMDKSHLDAMRAMAPAGTEAKISLLLDHLPDSATAEVPDPYYGGGAGFNQAFELIETGIAAFLNKISA